MMLRSPCLRPGVWQVPGVRTRLPEVRHRKPGPLWGRPGSFPHGHQPAPRGLALLPHRGPRHSPWQRSSGPDPATSPAGAATPPAPLGPPPWPPAQGCPACCLPAARRRPPGSREQCGWPPAAGQLVLQAPARPAPEGPGSFRAADRAGSRRAGAAGSRALRSRSAPAALPPACLGLTPGGLFGVRAPARRSLEDSRCWVPARRWGQEPESVAALCGRARGEMGSGGWVGTSPFRARGGQRTTVARVWACKAGSRGCCWACLAAEASGTVLHRCWPSLETRLFMLAKEQRTMRAPVMNVDSHRIPPPKRWILLCMYFTSILFLLFFSLPLFFF